jgi:hypothetical protein
MLTKNINFLDFVRVYVDNKLVEETAFLETVPIERDKFNVAARNHRKLLAIEDARFNGSPGEIYINFETDSKTLTLNQEYFIAGRWDTSQTDWVEEFVGELKLVIDMPYEWGLMLTEI